MKKLKMTKDKSLRTIQRQSKKTREMQQKILLIDWTINAIKNLSCATNPETADMNESSAIKNLELLKELL